MGLPVLAIAGAGISALGSIGSGIAQGNAAAYNAQVARNNAITAQQNATYATQSGYASSEDEGLKAAEQLGQQGAAIAANDVTNTGSASKVLQGSREIGALDQAQVMQNAELQAYGYRTQATGFEATAGLESAEAGFDPLAGVVSGTGSFLTGLSNVATKFPGTFTVGGGPNANAIGQGSQLLY
jgi:hypothetical protein